MNYFLFITTALIGFTFYYFFPTTAPASIVNSPFFSEGLAVGFLILLPINGLLMASCLLLGWHYAIDILGAFLVIFLSHALCWKLKKQRQNA